MTSQTFWFPIMKNDEIIQALKDWGVHSNDSLINKPTPEFVYGIYTACLQRVTGITPELLIEPAQEAMESLQTDSEELYLNPLAHIIFLQHMRRFAKAAQIFDFNGSDLTNPESERTRSILSAFINFIKFTEQTDEFIDKLRSKSRNAAERRLNAERNLEDITRKYEEIERQRRADEPHCEKLRAENDARKQQLMASEKQWQSIRNEVDKLKIERDEINQRKEQVEASISVTDDSVQRLRSRIVQSPDRIRRTIQTMGITVNEDKKQIGLYETKARDLQAKIAALTTIEKDIRGCVEQLQTIEKEVDLLEGSRKELTDIKDHLNARKVERQELQMRQSRAATHLSNATEKLARAKAHATEKQASSEANLARLKDEYESMSADRQENNRNVESLRNEAETIERQMAEHLKASELELDGLLEEYRKLRHQSEVYMEVLAGKLKIKIDVE